MTNEKLDGGGTYSPVIRIYNYGTNIEEYHSFLVACCRHDSQGKITSWFREFANKVIVWVHQHNRTLPHIVFCDFKQEEIDKLNQMSKENGFKSLNSYITNLVRKSL